MRSTVRLKSAAPVVATPCGVRIAWPLRRIANPVGSSHESSNLSRRAYCDGSESFAPAHRVVDPEEPEHLECQHLPDGNHSAAGSVEHVIDLISELSSPPSFG